MKKRKSIWLTLLTVVVAVAMLFGTGAVSAFADEDTTTATSDAVATASAQVVKSVEYNAQVSDIKKTGDNITAIKAPNGESLDLTTGTFNQIGVYTVELANGYTYTISCTAKDNYELRVENNGADIPTIIAAGGTFTLPAAAVWKESDNKYIDFTSTSQKVYCEIEGATVTLNGNAVTKIQVGGEGAQTGYEVKLEKARAYTVHYYCNIDDGTKYIYKDYTVTAQKNFNDTTAPTLNLVNMPTTISLNTKVTLPKATATDNYDQNVKVAVTVKQFDENATSEGGWVDVLHYEPDENGYGDKENENSGKVKEVFDNEYNLSFYPMEATKYQITYQAFDDAGNSSTERIYTATASDRTSPVFKSIEEDKIPTVWGITVEKKAVDNDNGEVDQVIAFPTPVFVDNGGAEDLSIIFELRDTVNNNVVVRFDNILDTESEDKAGSTYKYNSSKPSYGLYPTEGETSLAWANGKLELDITKYTALAKAETDDHGLKGKTVTGRYTARYEARDKAGNSESVTYNIDLRDSFADTVAPNINDVKFDDSYLVFTDTEEDFVIPSIEVSDDNDENPTVEYKLIAAENGDSLSTVSADNKVISVKGGETAKLVLNDGTPTLTVEDDGETKTLEFANNEKLFWLVTATDDVGNPSDKSNSKDGLTIVDADDVKVENNNTVTLTSEINDELEVGKNTVVANLTVEGIKEEKRDFYGFEISLYTTKDGVTELWQNGEVTVYTYYDKTAETLHVDDIKFAAPAVDSVTMYIRVYGISGDSRVVGYTFAVDNTGSDDDNIYSALSWRNEGNVYVSYVIKNRELPAPKDTQADPNATYIVREITGNGRFSLMGYQFTAYNAGSYSFAEYYKLKGEGEGENVTYPNGKYRLFDGGAKDTIVITDSSTPVWNLQGKMPTYAELSENGTKVELPKLVAATQYANAKVELTATFTAAGSTNAVTQKISTSADDNSGKDFALDANGVYSFVPTQDGVYKLTYTASYGDAQSVKQEFEIKVGDITPPDFTIASDHAKTATENDTFTFKTINVNFEEGESVSDMTFTKTLKDPAGNTVYTVKGTGETYRTMAKPSGESDYVFTKTGVYTVTYEVTDKAGNTTPIVQTITVSAANVSSPVSTKIISTILIIVGVLLIAGVILYFVRFRKVKSK